jgi:hypothetical protein
MKKIILLSSVAIALMADTGELQQLKENMAQMQAMMQQMQSKISALETQQQDSVLPSIANVEAPTAKPVTVAATPAPSVRKSFIPDISLIVDGGYVDRNVNDEQMAHLEIPGIVHGVGSGGHEGHDHSSYYANNGFNLNYAELNLSGSVDHWFDLWTTLHFSEEGVDIEEAYFTTKSLPAGLRLKGGKFKSDFGYLNQFHQHAWSFADAPLVYDGFLGSHGLQENGLQLQWVAPMNHYLMVGVEALQGGNESTFGDAAIVNPNDPEDVIAASPAEPSLWVGYVKTSQDIGDATAVLGGISYATGNSRMDHWEDENPHAFSGNAELYDVDLVVKHFFNSYQNIVWQSEWMYRNMDGTKYVNPEEITGLAMTKKQAGYYSQLVYAHDKNWKAGVRYDDFTQNVVVVNGINADLPNDLNRYTGMVEYKPSEYSYIRLQYEKNNALYNEEGQPQDLHSLILQFDMMIGAHPAHNF